MTNRNISENTHHISSARIIPANGEESSKACYKNGDDIKHLKVLQAKI